MYPRKRIANAYASAPTSIQIKKASRYVQLFPGSRKNFIVYEIRQKPYRNVEYIDTSISVSVTRYELELRSIQIASSTVIMPSTNCWGHVSSNTPVNTRIN